jgi:hypothetical protein
MTASVPGSCPTPELHGLPVPTLDYCANCIATTPQQRILLAGTSPSALMQDLEDAAAEDGYDGPVPS